MNSRLKRIISVFCLAAALFAAALLPISGYCENLRFVFLADSRGEHLSKPINDEVLDTMITRILALSPQPAFVVFGGDMSYRGRIDGVYTFQTWKNHFTPLTSAGINLYTALGNHELYQHPGSGFFLANQQQYQNVFTENPGNGPPGYERLVYSFPSPGGDAFFAVLDPYYLTADNPNPDITGTIDAAQLSWLSTQIAQTTATHKFLFTHGPYYHVTAFPNPGPPYPPDITYTNLWQVLDDNLFDTYFCGHTHLFSRKTIDSSILPNPPVDPQQRWKNNVVQVLNGTCGAGVDTSTPTVDPILWNIHQESGIYYYSVVDISGSQVTVNSYGGNTGTYSVIDSFTINRNAVPGADLLLLD